MGLLRYSNSEQTEIVDFSEVFDLGDTNTILSGITILFSPSTMGHVGHVGGLMVKSRLERLERPLTRAAPLPGDSPLAMWSGNFEPGQHIVQSRARKWEDSSSLGSTN